MKDQLALYRSDHRIQVEDGRCTVDGLDVWRIRGGGYRHDAAQIVKLIEAEYGSAWPRHGNEEMVDTDEPLDDEWTNREGMPEFNGAFR
jgi:hypothetical protein